MKTLFIISLLLILLITSFFVLSKFKLYVKNDELREIEVSVNKDSYVYNFIMPIGTSFKYLKDTLNIDDSYVCEFSDDYILYNKQTIDIIKRTSNLISINSASIEDLIKLPGIGEKTAANIVSYRKINNGFKSFDELLDVKGIGLKKYEKIKGLISL